MKINMFKVHYVDRSEISESLADVKCFVRNGAPLKESAPSWNGHVISCGARNKSESKLKVPLTR